MNRKIVLMLALPAILSCAIYPSAACTIFNAEGNGMLLVGNNEEHEDPNGEVRFEPASEGKYGKITFAFGPFAQGGMNERGLFFDCWAPNAFKLPPWTPGQLLPNGKVPDQQPTMDEMWQICTRYDITSKQMLESCATVEEAITWDWDKNEMRVTRKNDTFQVIGIGRDYIYPRLSRDSFEVSVESFRELLNNTPFSLT